RTAGGAAAATMLMASRRRRSMHAVVVTVGIDATQGDKATEMLHSTVVPDVKATPGFVSGTWARSEDGTKGHSLVVFENEDAAKEPVRVDLDQPGDHVADDPSAPRASPGPACDLGLLQHVEPRRSSALEPPHRRRVDRLRGVSMTGTPIPLPMSGPEGSA